MDFKIEKKNEKWWAIVLTIWMVSSIFTHLIYLPVLQYKIQIFELLFFVFAFRLIKNSKKILSLSYHLKSALFFYIALIIFNIIFHFGKDTVIDNLGSLYSCFIPIVFGFSLFSLSSSKLVIKNAFILIAILLPLTAFLGLALNYYGITDAYIYEYPNYPYLGDINRVRGFIGGPNEVVYVIAITFFYLFFVETQIKKNAKTILYLLLTITLFFTYGKEIILIPGAIIAAFFLLKIKVPILTWGYSILFSMLIIILTFFYFSSSEKENFREDIIQNETVAEFKELKIYPTSYFFISKSSIDMIRHHGILGVGFGNFTKEISKHQEEGKYPKELYIYKAHDNYMGLIAQYGIGYILVLLLFYRGFKKIINSEKDNKFFIAATCFFVLFCGFIHYSYHFRFMWMIFGILIYYSFLYQVQDLITLKNKR